MKKLFPQTGPMPVCTTVQLYMVVSCDIVRKNCPRCQFQKNLTVFKTLIGANIIHKFQNFLWNWYLWQFLHNLFTSVTYRSSSFMTATSWKILNLKNYISMSNINIIITSALCRCCMLVPFSIIGILVMNPLNSTISVSAESCFKEIIHTHIK